MAENIFKTKRNIDLVFCIDGTGSMAPHIESVKRNAVKFKEDFTTRMIENNSEIDSMRVKIIVFRDYKADGDEAMQISPFFELPMDTDDFEKHVNEINACGGGDAPENGLEALCYAMKSDFTTGSKDRQVIVLFTDADALPLKARAKETSYPADMVDDEEFLKIWNCASQEMGYKLRERNKRLLIYAPINTKYQELAKIMNRCTFVPVNMESGLKELDFDEIIKGIAASASGL